MRELNRMLRGAFRALLLLGFVGSGALLVGSAGRTPSRLPAKATCRGSAT
jgi:hypothetical protein